MPNAYQALVSIFAVTLPLISLGCSSAGDAAGTPIPGGSGSGGASSAGNGSGGTSVLPGTSGNTSASGAGGVVTTTGGNGNMSGAGNASGAGGMSGAGNVSGAGGMSGAGGGGNTAGAGGGAPYAGATGQSAGCGKNPPANDAINKFALHEIHITEPIAANYLVGGDSYDHSGKYDFQFRPYSVRLPTGYDPTKKYPVIMGGGGCGGNAADFGSNPGSGYDIDKNREAIFVGLSYVAGCFADGGGGTNKRADTPEVPYVHEVLAEVKANYCVDQSKVAITGHSSGGWESFTVGCALSNEIRAISPVSGGLRNHRPPCQGPQASIMVEGLGDNSNPIGPLVPPDGNLDSGGSAPARDEILVRNGCVAPNFAFMYTADNTKEGKAGNAPHTDWDPTYPECVTYTGCPAAFPVVWCALNGGHEVDNEGNLDYKVAMMKFFDALPSH